MLPYTKRFYFISTGNRTLENLLQSLYTIAFKLRVHFCKKSVFETKEY